MSLGPAVKDGEIRYVSVSQLERFDSRVDGGCERKWWFRYIARQPDGFRAATDLGEKVHAQMEHYLRTGDASPVGEVARPALELAPPPGEGLHLEISYGQPVSGVVVSPVLLDGAPVVGRLDLLDVRDLRRPHVLDFKTTSSIDKWAKSAAALAGTWQMRGYVPVALTLAPSAEVVRLSHLYMQTRGPRRAELRSTEVAASETAAEFREAGGALVRRMRQVALAARPEDVPANTDACGAYGGCPFRASCPRTTSEVLRGLISRAGQNERAVLEQSRSRQGGADMGLLAKRKAAGLVPPDAPPPETGGDAVEGLVMTAASSGPVQIATASPPAGEPLDLYVDASEDSVVAARLERVADEIAAEIAAAQGVADIRMGGSGPLGFGQWRGALAAAARERAFSGPHAVSSSSELGMVVFEALAARARRVVRGGAR